ARETFRKRCTVCLALEVLRDGPDDNLVDFYVGWLLDGVSDGASDRVGRNRHFHKLAQILSGCLVRTALREFRGNGAGRDHCAPDIGSVIPSGALQSRRGPRPWLRNKPFHPERTF